VGLITRQRRGAEGGQQTVYAFDLQSQEAGEAAAAQVISSGSREKTVRQRPGGPGERKRRRRGMTGASAPATPGPQGHQLFFTRAYSQAVIN